MYKKIVCYFICFFMIVLHNSAFAKTTNSQSVLSAGTKVSSATTNTLVDAECQDSFFGCMDAFCIVDNVSGGRCQCSSAFKSLNNTLNEIMKMDEEAYAIATYGVDHIEMGDAASDVLKTSEKAFNKAIRDANDESVIDKEQSGTAKATGSKKRVDLASWNSSTVSEDEEEEVSFDADDISGLKGEELRQSAQKMCLEQTPDKCNKSYDMLKMLYTQKIKSDCAAFENSLKQQKIASTEKLDNAKHGVLDAALNEYQNANKYDLGQCIVEFKKCMQTTAGCKEDWTGCVKLAAAESVASSTSGDITERTIIKGEFSSISLTASTLDSMLAKKTLCDGITKQCAKEKDNVWDAFLKDVAPELKTAELNAESDLRSNCLTSISNCYLKACKENMDTKEENGTYDMCLSRPENYKSFCKVELEPCLNATGGSYDNPDTSILWQGILAKLSAMRIDACTNEFKSCIQDEDRCGKDYSKCIGLDSEDIVDICPEDKLVACYQEYNGKKESVRDSLTKMAKGVLLNVDNEMLNTCEKAIDEAMVKVCGDSESCNNLIVDSGTGARTLEAKYCEISVDANNKVKYTNCKDNIEAISDAELGKITLAADGAMVSHDKHYFSGVIYGQIAWEYIMFNDDSITIDIDNYMEKVSEVHVMDDNMKAKVKTEIGNLINSINTALETIEKDPKIQYCITGRQVAGLDIGKNKRQMIGSEGNARFPNLTSQKRLIIASTALRQATENYYKKYDEKLEEISTNLVKLSKRMQDIDDKNEKQALRIACVRMGSGDTFAADSGLTRANRALATGGGETNGLIGHHEESSYNYKRSVTTTFNMDTGVCHKCVRTQNCSKTRRSYCKEWGEEQETCTDVEF